MYHEVKDLHLFAIHPVGHPDRTSVLLAISEQDAVNESLHHPPIRELAELGFGLSVRDLTNQFSKSGYDITVSKRGTFH